MDIARLTRRALIVGGESTEKKPRRDALISPPSVYDDQTSVAIGPLSPKPAVGNRQQLQPDSTHCRPSDRDATASRGKFPIRPPGDAPPGVGGKRMPRAKRGWG